MSASSTVANLESRASTIKFEKFFHNDLYKWIVDKVKELGITDAEVLDVSVDSVIFGQILAERLKAKKLDAVLRPNTTAPGESLTSHSIFIRFTINLYLTRSSL